MTFALLFVLGYATISAGGIGAVAENAKGLAGYLSFTSTHVQTATRQLRILFSPSYPHWPGAWATLACLIFCCGSWPLRMRKN